MIRTIPFAEIDKLKEAHPELVIEDQVALALDELYDIEYPAQKDSKSLQAVEAFGSSLTSPSADEWGAWAYYPWLNKLVHVPPVEALRALRTSRNRNLITAPEQKKLYDSTILIAGMSVGSNIVEALISQGIGSKLILVDMDIIEPSNLNRIRSPYHHIGLHKVEAIARKILEIDPYIEVVQVTDGLNENNLRQLLETHSIDVLVDEIDDVKMKITIREQAKAHGLPVVMAADDGDNTLLDIERYDLTSNMELFGGRIPHSVLDRIRTQEIPRAELGMLIGKYFVGAKNTPLRMFQSLGEVGKSLPSWPQLGGAAALSGVALTYVIRKILLQEKINDGRILISLDEKIDLEHLEAEHQLQLEKFQQMLGEWQ